MKRTLSVPENIYQLAHQLDTTGNKTPYVYMKTLLTDALYREKFKREADQTEPVKAQPKPQLKDEDEDEDHVGEDAPDPTPAPKPAPKTRIRKLYIQHGKEGNWNTPSVWFFSQERVKEYNDINKGQILTIGLVQGNTSYGKARWDDIFPLLKLSDRRKQIGGKPYYEFSLLLMKDIKL